jgi:dienelactone hydrolase
MFVAALPTAAADFPPPDKLPEHEGLPNPLVTFGGKTVSTVEDWEKVRKPELKELFQHYMYGHLPPAPTKEAFVVLHEDKQAFDGKATLREIEIRFDLFGKTNPLPIRLLLVLPNARNGPVPVFVGPNFTGNHSFVADTKVRLPDVWMPNGADVVKNRATEAGRGRLPNVWDFDQAIAKRCAIATFYCGDVQPDRPAAKEGMRAILPAGSDTETIATWAWGCMRCVDYLVQCPEVDKKKIAVVGHSRLGKTALLAGAFDDRIAVVMPHQAGCGGTGPSRHDNPKAETVKRINTSFPHWFCANFKEFNDATAKIPFDQNCLVALCAPRPVLITCATEDEWSNPKGQFAVLKAAEPAYKLYGVHGCAATEFPEVNQLVDSRLGYWIRPGKHSMTPADWTTFLAFGLKWMKS